MGGTRFAGIDRATNAHAVCMVEADGAIRARVDVPNTGKSFDGLVNRLVRLGAEDLAIERPERPLVGAMLKAALRVFVIAPRMLKALRQRYSATGAKSDPGDAYVLADVVRTDGRRLKPLVSDALTRTRKDLAEAMVALVKQFRAQLEPCFPGAVGLFHELDSQVSIAFLHRYPKAHRARSLAEGRLAAFLPRIGYCGRKLVEELLARLKEAPAAGLTEAEGRAACVLALLEAVELCNRARGKRHPHAVRILARAWVRVIWRIRQERNAYGVTKHGGAAMLRAA